PPNAGSMVESAFVPPCVVSNTATSLAPGAVSPIQLAPLLQLLSPAPVQTMLAGSSRVSSPSTWGRDQPLLSRLSLPVLAREGNARFTRSSHHREIAMCLPLFGKKKPTDDSPWVWITKHRLKNRLA